MKPQLSPRSTRLAIFVIALVAVMLMASAASACPNCKEAIAQNDPHGRSLVAGYFYSILFMMSMPFIILTTFGSFAYRAVKKAEAQRAAGLSANPPSK